MGYLTVLGVRGLRLTYWVRVSYKAAIKMPVGAKVSSGDQQGKYLLPGSRTRLLAGARSLWAVGLRASVVLPAVPCRGT